MQSAGRRVAAERGRVGIILFILTFLAGGLYGQQDYRGSIQGHIKDATGSVIPGATVTATLLSQNRTQTVFTDDQGFYAFPYLDPGSYQLKAIMPGFKTYERAELVIQVNDKLTIEITLNVGDVSQEIVVRGDTTPIVQEIPNFDQTVDEKQMEDLPMNGRNAYQLFQLAAGVLPEGDPTLMRPFDNDNTSNLTVGGTGARGTEFALDGGSNTSGGGRVVFIPSTEAVKEFKVTTSSFDSSVGNTTGPIINASLRSGGKQFRGSLYHYHRNSSLDANFWTAKRQGQQLARAQWNQFGGSLGGPLRIPFRERGKDRTFFFVNYEGMRVDRVSSPFIRTLPTESERRGDFSQTYYVDSRTGQASPIIIYDPLTTRCARNCDPPDPNNPGPRPAPVYERTPFPNNIIPPERLNPVAQSLLRFVPLPTRTGDPKTGRDNYVRNGVEVDFYDQIISRFDHQISSRQHLFFSLSFSNRNQFLPNWLGSIASPNLGVRDRSTRRFIVNDTYTLRGGMVMNIQYSLARYLDFFGQASIG